MGQFKVWKILWHVADPSTTWLGTTRLYMCGLRRRVAMEVYIVWGAIYRTVLLLFGNEKWSIIMVVLPLNYARFFLHLFKHDKSPNP